VESRDWHALLAALDGTVADVMVEEKFTRSLASRSGNIGTGRLEGGSTMHTNPDSREIRDLLQRARTVAVVGLSDKPYRTSHAIAGALQRFGFKIFPVNPNLDGPVLGEEPYASLRDITTAVDIVDVFRSSEKVMPVAEDAVASGAKVLWMQTGVINEEAAAYAEEHGLTVVMDRCIKVDYATLVGPANSHAGSPFRQGE
jgi:predicted CoA-binding protein